MYDLSDTIIAVSSPTPEQRVIIRITGPDTLEKCQQIFSHTIPKAGPTITTGGVTVDPELRIDAKLYLFPAPHSYTGEDVAEIHISTNSSVTEALIAQLLRKGLRTAGPGEFTARAYLNGKIDLAQAEAVNEIIVGSNKFQLAAAEKLLAGRLAETTARICSQICDCLSLIEAGLDFSHEDIEFITRQSAVQRLTEIKNQLEQLRAGSISYEAVIDLPSVGIAGAPNAGKSSLLNALLGQPRSIVSDQRKTTRDILSQSVILKHSNCVLFDCAGLTAARIRKSTGTNLQNDNTVADTNIIDELARQAAIEALRNASMVVFCVDIAKSDWAEDIQIRKLIEPKALIPVATKSDLIQEQTLDERICRLNDLFSAKFTPTSSKTGAGLELVRETIDKKIVELTSGPFAQSTTPAFSETLRSGVALIARHRQAVIEAIDNITESIEELQAGNDEVAAMMLRASHQVLSTIEQQNIDEQILDRIFSRFCIGK